MRERRRRRVAARGVDADLDPVRDEHLDRGVERGLGQRVRVTRDEQGPVDPLPSAVAGDRLADGQDMGFGERALERRAAVPGGAERHGSGGRAAVRGEQFVEVDELRRVWTGSGGGAHAANDGTPSVSVRACGSSRASTRSSSPWRTLARPVTWAASRCSTRPRRPAGRSAAPRCGTCWRSAARSSRRCAGGSPKCRSGSTTRTGSRRPRWTSATTCARWRWRRRGPTSSSPTRWRGSCRGRSTVRGRCGSCT